MMVHAPISHYHSQQPPFDGSYDTSSFLNMNPDRQGGQRARRVYAAPDPGESSYGADNQASPYIPPQHLVPSQGALPAVTGVEQAWSTFVRDPYTPPSVLPWPQYSTTMAAGDELGLISSLGAATGTDADSTAAFDDELFQEQIAHYSEPFDVNRPMPWIHNRPQPEPVMFVADTATPPVSLPPATPYGPVASPVMALNPMGQMRMSSAPASQRRSSTPAAAAVPVSTGTEKSRGKKREGKVTTAAATPKRPTQVPRSRVAATAEASTRKTPTPATVPESSEQSTSAPTVAKPATKNVGNTPGACWRCRRYKKPCNNREGTCDTCWTSGFRIWPASLGCRRGDIQEFVDAIMPDGMEDIVDSLSRDLPGTHTWRSELESPVSPMPAEIEGRQPDKWDHLSEKVLSTRLFGQEFVELFETLARHQREAAKEHPLFNLVAATLSYSVDLYHRFVVIGEEIQPEAKVQTARENIISLRTALSNTTSAWLSLCLRGRLSDFPVAFVVAALTLCSLIIFSDTVAALKMHTGELIWTNSAREQMMALRVELMTIAVDLLGVVAKGSKPLRFRCFHHAPGEPRSAEGLRLMGDNAASFDIMAALQQWITRYGAIFGNDEWSSVPSFTPGIRPIQAMARFVRMAYGETQEQ